MQNLIKNLYKAYDQLNELKFNGELVPCTITVQSKPKTKTTEVFGWVTRTPVWIKGEETEGEDNKENRVETYEINIVAESLKRPYIETIGTLLHEMAHLSNLLKGIDDCSLRGKHNEKFKQEAERVGFTVEIQGRTGYSQTIVTDELAKEFNNLNVDKDVFTLHRFVEPKEKRKVNRKPTYKYRCNSCGKVVKSTEAELVISCGDCAEYYEECAK